MIARFVTSVLLFIIVVASLSSSAAQAAQKFPYQGYISGRNVYVRSGPGKDYYPTDQLQKGHRVMIYRHEPGGWCAIRPPEGSFSWVAARYLRPTEDQMAVVSRANVASRIGSNLRRSRDIVSVRLQKGEKVEILGADRSGSKTWYKISPPDGEFRWVHLQFVKRHQPEGDPLQMEDNPEPKSLKNRSTTQVDPNKKDTAVTFAKKSTKQLDHKTDDSNPNEKVRLASSEQSTRTTKEILKQNQTLPQKNHTSRVGSTTSDLQETLDDIDAELSQRIEGDSARWQLDDLLEETEVLLSGTKNGVDRGRVKTVLQKIKQFDSLAQRQRKIDQVMKDTSRQNQILDRRVSSTPTTKKVIGGQGRFDGLGRLIATRSLKLGTPPFVLMDDNNRVLMYVSPAPGVNLRPFANQKIGIQGIRGYMTRERKPHLTAKRIVPLGPVRR